MLEKSKMSKKRTFEINIKFLILTNNSGFFKRKPLDNISIFVDIST